MGAQGQTMLLVLLLIIGHWCSVVKGQNTTQPTPVSQLCKGSICNLNSVDVLAVRKTFFDLVDNQIADVIYFNFDFGRERSKLSRQSDTFDPTLWAWVSSRGKFLLNLPLDYDIVSLGLLALKVYNLKISVTAPCITTVTAPCRDHLVAELILKRITSKTINATVLENAMICRSAYTHATLVADNIKGVGMKCCTQQSLAARKDGLITCQENFSSEKNQIRNVIFAFGVLFPLFFFYYFLGWQRFRLISYGYRNRVSDCASLYFGSGTSSIHTYTIRDTERTDELVITISDEDLTSNIGHVTMQEIWSVLGGTKRSAKCLALFKFCGWTTVVSVAIFFLLPELYRKHNTLFDQLRDGDEISYNLRSIPVGWYKTKTEFWPYKFSICLIIAVYLYIIVDFITVMLFCLCPPSRATGKPRQTLDAERGRRGSRSDTAVRQSFFNTVCGVCLSLLILAINICIGALYIAAIFYALSQIFVYVILAVVVNVDVILPYLIGILALLFYINDTINRIKKPYVEVKRFLYEDYLKREDILIAHSLNYSTSLDGVDQSVLRQEVYRSKPSSSHKLSNRKAAGLLLVYCRGNCPRLLAGQYFDMCDHLVNKWRNIGRALCRLLMVVVFGCLVIFTLTALKPEGEYVTRTMHGLLTGIAAVLALLTPQVGRFFRDRDIDKVRQSWWRFEIRRYLNTLLTDIDSVVGGTGHRRTRVVFDNQEKDRWSPNIRDDGSDTTTETEADIFRISRSQIDPDTNNGWLPKQPSAEDAETPLTTTIKVTPDKTMPSFPLYAGQASRP